MKKMKKIASIMMALVMALAMTLPVMAAGGEGTEQAQTGSITINPGTNVGLTEEVKDEDGNVIDTREKTFTAYKVLDVEIITKKDGSKGFAYIVPEELRGFYAKRYTIDLTAADFDSQVAKKVAEEVNSDKDKNVFTFATEILDAADKAGITGKTGSIADNKTSYTISDLPLGYYVVKDNGEAKPVSALVLDTVGANQPINIKADKPDIDKKIDGVTDEDPLSPEQDVTTNQGYIGDKVPYKITSRVPDMTGYEKYFFVVNDTLSKGLTYNDDLTVEIGDTSLSKVEVIDVTKETKNAYTLTQGTDDEGNTTIEIVFVNFIQYKDQKNADISIKYSATINENAEIGEVGNENTVKLTYSNDPNKEYKGDPDNPNKPSSDDPKGETPEKEVRTFVTSIKLTKVDENNKPLTGAIFELTGLSQKAVLINEEVFVKDDNGTYYLLKNGKYTQEAPTQDTADKKGTADQYESKQKYSKITQVTQDTKEKVEHIIGEVDENGILEFKGLSAGEYTISEKLAPAGYNKLDASLQVKIKYTAPENGKLTPCKWEVDPEYADNEKNGFEYDATNKIFTLKVTNKTGSQLPSTGGIGTTIFYIIGGILVLGAAILLITKKRVSKEV